MILKTATKTYDLAERTHIMGILNVTPDSFSDGGNYTSLERAVKQAIEMEKQGADIIDIGGESTRPNHKAVSLDRSEEHTCELQSRGHLVCRLLLEKKKNNK